MITNSPSGLGAAGLAPEQVEPALRSIYREVSDKGPVGHILTGPVYVEGAQPGDVLEVRIESIRLKIPYAYNGFRPGAGFLPDEFPYARVKIIPLDESRMVARFSDHIEIPLRPFFGSMGVAPPEASGRISSAPPWIHAGNLDNKEFVAGTTLFIPVHAPGALFQVGDGHAGQGKRRGGHHGTRNCAHRDFPVFGPQRPTPALAARRDAHPLHHHGPPRGFARSNETRGRRDVDAWRGRVIRTDFLVTEKHLTRDDAYMLTSVAADLSITQLVDGNKGVHAMIAKSIFRH